MPTIHEETLLDVCAEAAWDAVRDVGALHTRLVPGFVTHTELVPGARIVTFANGSVFTERIVDVDDAQRRLVWSIDSPQVAHHNGAVQVFPAGPGRCRVVWIADVLPQAVAKAFAPRMRRGLEVMKATLEANLQPREHA
jgi:hypothetical protein